MVPEPAAYAPGKRLDVIHEPDLEFLGGRPGMTTHDVDAAAVDRLPQRRTRVRSCAAGGVRALEECRLPGSPCCQAATLPVAMAMPGGTRWEPKWDGYRRVHLCTNGSSALAAYT